MCQNCRRHSAVLLLCAIRYDGAPDDGFEDEELVPVQLLAERESQQTSSISLAALVVRVDAFHV